MRDRRRAERSGAREQDGGDVAVGTIPKSTAGAKRHFDAVAETIVTEWVARRSLRSKESETPHSWFKRNMYRLIKAYVDKRRAEIFTAMARGSGRSSVGLTAIEENPYKLALFAMWSDNESLTRHQQRVFGNQMMYAHLHGVPPEHLIGFIRAAGSHQRIAEKLKQGAREPSFGLGR
jgi:hypothetical protein